MSVSLSVAVKRYTIISFNTKKACIIDTGYMNDKDRMCFYILMGQKIAKPFKVIANVILLTSKQLDVLLQFFLDYNNVVCAGHYLDVPLYYVAGSPISDRLWDNESVKAFNDWDGIASLEV